jgi:hypothetical protein
LDLNAYGRVFKNRWYVVLAGVLLAFLLAVLSYYRISADGSLTPRKAELWQSQGKLFLTENGFPAGRRTLPLTAQQVGGESVAVPVYNDPYKYASLASLYAQFATGDDVRRRIQAAGGSLPGSYSVAATADTTFGRAVSLPAVTVFGKATTPAAAVETTRRVMTAFTGFIEQQQRQARIPEKNRVLLQTLNAPEPAVLIEGRKKTLPIAVFLAVLFAAVAFAFVLDNLRRTRSRAVASADAPTADLRSPDEAAPHEEAPAPPATLPVRRRAPGSTLR